MSRSCPACEDIGLRPSLKISTHQLLLCSGCGHEFLEADRDPDHIETVYGDDYFFGGGAGYPDYPAEARSLISRGRFYGKKLRSFGEAGELLDVGAAAGYLLEGFSQEGWTGEGIEPNELMATLGGDRLGIDIHCGTLESYDLGSRQFDAVAAIQVMAHFADPEYAWARLSNLVRPGGLLLVETWDRGSLTRWLLGRHWHEYSPPSVLHWFTKTSLDELARRHGFYLLESKTTIKWISGNHACSLVASKLPTGAASGMVKALGSKLPDFLRLPNPGDDLFYSIYRKQPASG